MKIKIAENIRKLRKSHSLTQEQMAEVLGVTVGAVYKWEASLSMLKIMNSVIHTWAGIAYMYAKQKNEKCLLAANWLIAFFDSLKMEQSEITFFDKLKAVNQH